jgi:16S rRNA (cytosine1402-N4)-methyltransferase
VTTPEHVPVLLSEAMQALDVQPDGVYVDATYGRGGHSGEILKRLGGDGRLYAMDRDPVAVADARERYEADGRFCITGGPFSMLGKMLDEQGLRGKVNGVLFDLGVSSPQLHSPERGFSFRFDGPLDMRMDPAQGIPASEWINRAEESEIARVIRDYGEERFARRVARAIVRARSEAPITTTGVLADIVRRAIPARERGQDPATRTFQAIRLYVNRELEEIQSALPQAVEALAPRGRLAVISFHSLEDRIVKRFIRDEARGVQPPPGLPIRESEIRVRLKALGKPVYASEAETARNPRARSAVLRVAERTEGATHA